MIPAPTSALGVTTMHNCDNTGKEQGGRDEFTFFNWLQNSYKQKRFCFMTLDQSPV